MLWASSSMGIDQVPKEGSFMENSLDGSNIGALLAVFAVYYYSG